MRIRPVLRLFSYSYYGTELPVAPYELARRESFHLFVAADVWSNSHILTTPEAPRTVRLRAISDCEGLLLFGDQIWIVTPVGTAPVPIVSVPASTAVPFARKRIVQTLLPMLLV